MESIDLELLTRKISSKQEAKRFCKTIGKYQLVIKGFELGDEKIFSTEHFYNFVAGKKCLLKSEDNHDIDFPCYHTIKELKKDSLLDYCKNSIKLRIYLPELENLENIPRDFLLKVRLLIYHIC